LSQRFFIPYIFYFREKQFFVFSSALAQSTD
jgi:hypothetical protein